MGEHSWNGREANRAYLNLGDGPFWDVSLALGLDSIADGRGFVAFDFDHDGDLDLLVGNSAAAAQLFVNHWGDRLGYHWLKVELVGSDGRPAVGATVRVHSGGRIEARSFSLGNAHASSHAGPLLFGLGTATQVDRIEVTWPGGRKSSIDEVSIDRLIRLGPEGELR